MIESRPIKCLDRHESVNTDSVFVERYEDRWGVFYKGNLLKSFKSSTCAYAYACDSALSDIHEQTSRQKSVTKKHRRKGSPLAHRIRHIETGKIYGSILEASEDLGISNGAICKVLNGQVKTVKGQHFERVK